MRFAVHLPNLGPFSEVALLLDLAKTAEQAGWDGFFLWDHVAIPERMADTMTVLAAIAVQTQRIKFGPMITAPSRRRPWKLAREAITLDQLSGGRFILGVGLGASDYDFDHCGEETDLKIRAEQLDEALTIFSGLQHGTPFSFMGKHYQVNDLCFLPKPLAPIPIWVAGWHGNLAPMRRAARWAGVFPIGLNASMTPDDWRVLLHDIHQQRGEKKGIFEAVHTGITPNDPQQAAKIVQPYQAAGVTWWFENISPERLGWRLGDTWPEPWDIEKITERIAFGPPALAR